MKIAHVVDSMEVGGAETLVAQLCRLQRAQGHHPSIFAVGPLGALGQRMVDEGFTVRPDIGSHLSDSARNFYRLFKQLKPDAVHLHNPTPTIYAAAAARFAGAAAIVSTRHSLIAPPHDRVMELKYAIAARFCNSVVGICDATANNLRSLHTVPRKKILRIYNGAVPLERTAPEKLPQKSGFTLVFVGRMEPVKNHALLLNSFRAALSSLPQLRLWMVGDGSERARMESLAAELGIAAQVTFWGQQLDVAPYFSAADLFIMSSVSEGLPMSLLQAFSLGIPAVVTNVGGMAEVVRAAQAGIVVPSGDAAAMAQAIVAIAEGGESVRQFSQNAEQAFREKFSLQTMADAYMQLYRTTT